MENATSTTGLFNAIRQMVRSCIQCGTCSGSCPAARVMEHTPRALWRLVQLGQKEAVLDSKSFVYCASCYACTLRCPRGLPLTQAMAGLKEIAAKTGLKRHRRSTNFYTCFVESIRRHGRVNEVEMMTRYFWSLKDPLVPVGYLPLGIRLVRKGKLPLATPSGGTGGLDVLFAKIREMEAQA